MHEIKKKTKKIHKRITKIKPFINRYNREGITFLSKKDDWKKFEKNNVSIAPNVLYAKREKTSYCFNVRNREKWHYLTEKWHYQHYQEE